jgi:hypothetical protein
VRAGCLSKQKKYFLQSLQSRRAPLKAVVESNCTRSVIEKHHISLRARVGAMG